MIEQLEAPGVRLIVREERDHGWVYVLTHDRLAESREDVDMLGNVWEYCQETENGVPVFRGGSWREPSSSLSCASRTLLDPEWFERDPQRPRSKWWVVDGPFLGFRLARSDK